MNHRDAAHDDRLRHARPGTLPGTIAPRDDALPSTVRVISYGPDDFDERAVDDLETLRDRPADRPVTWVNVDGLADGETIARLGEIFDLHRLALEDVVNVHQRAKVEVYGRQIFTVTHMATLGRRVETEQVSLFLGDGFVLTFQERPGDCFEPVRDRLRRGLGRIRQAGADYLAYSLLDAVIDNYFPVLEEYGERLEELEGEVVARPDESVIADIHRAKRELLTLRRAVWPQREAANAMLREHMPQIVDETRIYLRDCYDHVIQIIDMVETYRELTGGLVDVYMSGVSNRMNEVMKVLTIIATVFIPLSFVAGVYGMNFSPEASPWNMPELDWRYGYPFTLGLMTAMAGGMLLYFRSRGWLGGARKARRRRAKRRADRQAGWRKK